jgi:hypothetical protein
MKFLYYDENEHGEIVDAIANISITDVLKVARSGKVENAFFETGIRINTLLPLTAENHNKITIWINVLDETVSVTRHSFDPILDIWFDEDIEKLEISHSEIEALLTFEDEYFRANFSLK